MPTVLGFPAAAAASDQGAAAAPGSGSGRGKAGDKVFRPVATRLTNAEKQLSRWSYAAEVVYTWLGLISLGVASFSFMSHGGVAASRGSMGIGMVSAGASVLCALVGWTQARLTRSMGRKCGLAASQLPLHEGNQGSLPKQWSSVAPPLRDVEQLLILRQRTAWLGILFAVVGLQAMVGLLVGKVLTATGPLGAAPGVSLDVFTLLAVGNAALSHVIGCGIAHGQQRALLPPRKDAEGPFNGWDQQ